MKRMAILVMLAASACTPTTEWVRAGTTLAQRQHDERACERIAAEQALDESFASGPIYPPYRDTQFTIDAGGENGGGGPTASYSRRGPRQYELAAYCMEQRGYRLVPVQS